jgi:signal transduction histidine kinase
VEQVSASAADVTLERRGIPAGLPPTLELSAYRVVQEALTNVVKHAGHTRAQVIVEYGDEGLLVEVTDDGNRHANAAGNAADTSAAAGNNAGGNAAAENDPAGDDAENDAGNDAGNAAATKDGLLDRPASDGGWGIVGIRERAALFGGTVEAGPRREGGFRISVRFPVIEAVGDGGDG